MARILVTGASGFIGFHVVRALVRKGHDVTCLARRQSNFDRLAGLDFRRAEGDVRDADSLVRAVAGQDAVYHIAGLVKAARAEQLYEVNCEGAANIARACAAVTTPPVLMLMSSLAAVGPSTPKRPRLESDPPAPVSNYGRSKLAGEQEARKWAAAVPITILRPPIVFGEGDRATLEMFRPIARSGIHVVPSYRTHRASLLHAEDLATAILLAAECGRRIVRDTADLKEMAKGCYFLSAERDVTFPELGRMMGAALGRRWTFVLPLTHFGVWVFGLSAEAISKLAGKPWFFSMDKSREARAGSWTCSPAAAKRDFQFAVAKPLEDRMRQTVDWYREQHWL
jgi:nucleoside-diphosphate-sugar epimerase